jgi:hypothetical protein
MTWSPAMFLDAPDSTRELHDDGEKDHGPVDPRLRPWLQKPTDRGEIGYRTGPQRTMSMEVAAPFEALYTATNARFMVSLMPSSCT